MSERLLSFKETANVLGVSVRTVMRLRNKGKLACRTMGHRVLFDKRDVSEFIDHSREDAWAYGETV